MMRVGREGVICPELHPERQEGCTDGLYLDRAHYRVCYKGVS